MANTLAYFAGVPVTKKKKFYNIETRFALFKIRHVDINEDAHLELKQLVELILRVATHQKFLVKFSCNLIQTFD